MNKLLQLAMGTALMAVSPSAFASETVTYSYDARGRVIKVEHTGTVNNNIKTEYTIDKVENWTNVKVTVAS